MKIENLENFPMQLDDERIIGAAGTDTSRREYGLEKLSERDYKRVERGILRVMTAEEDSFQSAPPLETKPVTPGMNPSESSETKLGGKK